MPTEGHVDLGNGLRVDEPPVVVLWGICESDLQSLLGPALRRVTKGYWVARVRVLGGLSCNLGFHFRDARGGLSELEFFRDSYEDQAASFEEFQHYFEVAFGVPTEQRPGAEGFPSYRWRVPGAEIVHYVFDRFGPEEHMRIRRQ